MTDEKNKTNDDSGEPEVTPEDLMRLMGQKPTPEQLEELEKLEEEPPKETPKKSDD